MKKVKRRHLLKTASYVSEGLEVWQEIRNKIIAEIAIKINKFAVIGGNREGESVSAECANNCLAFYGDYVRKYIGDTVWDLGDQEMGL